MAANEFSSSTQTYMATDYPSSSPTVIAIDEYPVSWYAGYIAVLIVIFLSLLVALIFMTSLASSKRVRTKPFNLYVLLLLFPDTILLLELAILTTSKVVQGDSNKEPETPLCAHRLHQWAQPFYYVANFYLNAIITHEVFNMVKASQRFRRYSMPSLRKVLLQAGSVFLLSTLYSLWWVLDVPWAAVHYKPNGKVKGTGSEVFSAQAVTIMYFCVLIPPILYMFYVGIYTWWKKLLKPTGRTRELYLYFMKIMVMYIVFYIPGVTINLIRKAYINVNDELVSVAFWVGLFMDFLFPIQTMVVVYLALSKEDIRVAWDAFFWRLCCKPINEEDFDDMDGTRINRTSRTVMESSTQSRQRIFNLCGRVLPARLLSRTYQSFITSLNSESLPQVRTRLAEAEGNQPDHQSWRTQRDLEYLKIVRKLELVKEEVASDQERSTSITTGMRDFSELLSQELQLEDGLEIIGELELVKEEAAESKVPSDLQRNTSVATNGIRELGSPSEGLCNEDEQPEVACRDTISLGPAPERSTSISASGMVDSSVPSSLAMAPLCVLQGRERMEEQKQRTISRLASVQSLHVSSFQAPLS